MPGSLSWNRDSNTLSLSGELDSETMLPLWQERESIVANLDLIDLRALTRIDTAGIALLIHFFAIAKQQGSRLQLTGMSSSLLTLLQLYNLPEEIFPRQQSQSATL